jgi:hypothetical protein
MGYPLPGLNGLTNDIVPDRQRAIPAVPKFGGQINEFDAIFPIAESRQLWYISPINILELFMKKRGGLNRLFKRFAAGTVLSAGILTGTATAQAVGTAPQPVAPVVTQPPAPLATACPAFPDFHMPDGPMHRIPRNRTVDLNLRNDQLLLKQIGINPGATDGLNGGSSRAAIREFLLFYTPIYSGDANKYAMAAEDSTQLKKYADAATADAKTYKISTLTAASLGLAHARTGVPMATLAQNVNHKFGNAEWLYMVKTYGASYGMGFYAGHISADPGGKLSVDNPFIHRQILDLRDHPRLSALMTAEYVKNKDSIPAQPKTALPAMDLTVQAQQKELMALGYDIGKSADGIKGDLTTISIGEFQLLYGGGKATGTLTADEVKILKTAVDQARLDGKAYSAPTLASGPIRMASLQSGADFEYLMKLAEAESSFVHTAKAPTSSATGLYQFIEGTWSYMVMNYGAKHGLGDFASQVEIYKDELGRNQARIGNPLIRQALLDMRSSPQMAALMAADFQDENRAKEACYVTGDLTRTDLYLAHFLGPSDAVWFITRMQNDAGQSAADTFPEEAIYNEGVFYERKHGGIIRDRSLQEVYNVFARKFNETSVQAVAAPEKPKPPSPAT